MVDSCDSERLGVAKQELLAMLEVRGGKLPPFTLPISCRTSHYRWQEEELKDAILLVFANKQDSKGALNAQQVCCQTALVPSPH